ncbi:hypothetical protein [Natrinema sp. DC36]|uniref:DUF7344 domain-containing protein n=1 Tax=Natrinema sp. DC36 TaxID=2878680 RepID=UPI001CEFC8B2|nr:hypothetical protein [Natrinema sp. DC36]
MVSVEKVLDLLHNTRRRYTLYYLKEQSEAVHVDDVAKAVAEMEVDPATTEVSDKKIEQIELSLYHNHLQKVDSTEFISYNADEETIQLTDSPTKFDSILTVAKVLENSK